jgi:hypothetical protein
MSIEARNAVPTVEYGQLRHAVAGVLEGTTAERNAVHAAAQRPAVDPLIDSEWKERGGCEFCRGYEGYGQVWVGYEGYGRRQTVYSIL